MIINESYTVTISCCLCDEIYEVPIDLPHGWRSRYNGIDDELSGFCPKHSNCIDFTINNCSGCVGSWGECRLWYSFAYSYIDKSEEYPPLTEQDFTYIKSGICPKRTNGTFVVNSKNGKVDDIDISSSTSCETGEHFAQAIKDYIMMYSKNTP